MHETLPSFGDTGALPRFSLGESAVTQWHSITNDDLELIEEAPPTSIAPIALDAADLEDDVEELSISLLLEEPRRVPWKPVAIVAGLLCFVTAGILAPRGSQRSFLAEVAERPREPVVVSAPAPPPPLPVPPPIVVAPVKPVPTKGTLVTPFWARGRRVWIDGKPIAGHAPRVEAQCGKHTVRIGAAGKPKSVDIPCGGELKIAP